VLEETVEKKGPWSPHEANWGVGERNNIGGGSEGGTLVCWEEKRVDGGCN